MYQFINYKKVIKFFFIFFLYFPISNFSYSNIVDELTTLNNLYKEGAITKEEFSKAKSLILKSSQTETKAESKKIIEINPKKEIEDEQNKVDDTNSSINDLDLTSTYVSLEEFNKLGTYQKINSYPEGLFEVKKSSKHAAKEAMVEMYKTFVQKPSLLEK